MCLTHIAPIVCLILHVRSFMQLRTLRAGYEKATSMLYVISFIKRRVPRGSSPGFGLHYHTDLFVRRGGRRQITNYNCECIRQEGSRIAHPRCHSRVQMYVIHPAKEKRKKKLRDWSEEWKSYRIHFRLSFSFLEWGNEKTEEESLLMVGEIS